MDFSDTEDSPVLPARHDTRASCAAWRPQCDVRGRRHLLSAAGPDESRQLLPAPGPRESRSLARMLLAGVVALLVAACASADAAEDEVLRFDGSAAGLGDLGSQVLTALERGDRQTLERLRLTEAQHNGVVWPELPAAAPGVNYPLDLAWQNLENRNHRGLERIMPLYRYRHLGLQRVECRGAIEPFETFEVLTDCWVLFTVDDAPRLFEAQIFKDVLVRGGGHKIFRYYDEEPRPYSAGTVG